MLDFILDCKGYFKRVKIGRGRPYMGDLSRSTTVEVSNMSEINEKYRRCSMADISL
jgi:hypothetical protein